MRSRFETQHRGLLLARAVSRIEDFAVHAALGATDARLIRASLLEGVILSLTGAVIGLLFAGPASRALIGSLCQSTLPLTLEPSPDRTVVAFAALQAVCVGAVFGLMPAPIVTGRRVQLTGRRVASASPAISRAGAVLITAQGAMAVVLVWCPA